MVAQGFRAAMLAAIALGLAACGDEEAETESAAVAPPNRAPTINGLPPRSVVAGQVYSFTPTATDPDGDPIRFGVDGLPAWATFNATTGELTGTPQVGDIGIHRGIIVRVSDGMIDTLLPAVDIEVLPANAPPNRAPVISGTPSDTVIEGNAYDFLPIVSDADGDPLTFEIENRPAWASFDPAIGRLNGTPDSGDVGPYAGIVIRVSDGTDVAALGPFAISVNPQPAQNRAPLISGTAAPDVVAGQSWSFQPQASDPDGDPLSFQVFGAPAWMNLDASTGLLSGTPGPAAVGTYGGIQLVVSDGAASASLPAFAVTVLSTNRAPTIGGTPTTSTPKGQPYSFTPTASDPDGDSLTFTVTGLPAWATFNGMTGNISGTPVTAGTFSNIVITARDPANATASLPAFSITVVNSPPVISGTPTTSIAVGQFYSFTPTASDPDGDTLTFTATGVPGWASFNSGTGRISGTPQAAGTFANIVITARDGQAATSLPAFSISVSVPNSPPAIGGTPPASVPRGQLYSFTPTATDPNGDTLTFTVTGLPAWATFSGTTGQISGTPTTLGTYSNIVITVRDPSQASASLPAFSIAVVNLPPVIGGTPPPAILVGSAYSFAPTASDPNGDTLTFTAAGLPAWASLNPSTGAVTGTPLAPDVGVYSGISITVSDGTASATLGPFSIQVQATATGSALLTWVPPTQNTDGSQITDLAGFKVYWGTAPGSYPNSVRLANPGLTTYLVTNLLPGTTYYFVTTAFNSLDQESAFSNMASKAIP